MGKRVIKNSDLKVMEVTLKLKLSEGYLPRTWTGRFAIVGTSIKEMELKARSKCEKFVHDLESECEGLRLKWDVSTRTIRCFLGVYIMFKVKENDDEKAFENT